jgi:hypothetical protein
LNKRILGAIALLAALAASAANAQGVKWHPGHYVMLLGGETRSGVLTRINEIGQVPAIKGVQVRIWWHELEPQKGVYDFSSINAYLNRLKAQPTPKRLVVRIMDRRFGVSSRSNIVPNYLLTQSIYNGGLVRTKNGYAARLWEAPVMDRLIALYRAIGARYDGDAYFEGVMTEETTLGLTNFPSGYSHAKVKLQHERLAAAASNAMPHTNVFVNASWIGSTSLMQDLYQSFVPLPVAAGGSNTIPGDMTLGQRVLTGVTGADYRGRLAIGTAVETGELGGSHGDFTPQQINNYAYNTLRANHVFWAYNTWKGDSTQRWSTGIKPFLRSNPPVRTACPTSYGWCKN